MEGIWLEGNGRRLEVEEAARTWSDSGLQLPCQLSWAGNLICRRCEEGPREERRPLSFDLLPCMNYKFSRI